MRFLLLIFITFTLFEENFCEDGEASIREKCFAAVDNNDVDALRTLIQKNGAFDKKLVNLREKSTKQTLLLKSILMGKTEIVSFLLDAGADVTIPEKKHSHIEDGYFVMDAATFQGRPDIIKLLAARGVEINSMHTDGHRPIHRAVWGTTERHTEAVKTLLDLGVSAETKNQKECLARAQYYFSLTNSLGETCLQIANDMPKSRRNLDTIKLLEESIKNQKQESQEL